MPPHLPTSEEELALRGLGYVLIGGVDEAGAGCWAGPVYAGAVVLADASETIGAVRDSKTLSERQRDDAAERIKAHATAWAVGVATAKEIDELNIRRAGALAMRRAVEALRVLPDFVLSDAFAIPGLVMPMKGIVRGDMTERVIAAASIIAKTERDRHMRDMAEQYEGYGFASHKGYGTKVHAEALRRLGPCIEHRRTYAPVKSVIKANAL